jgi:hypothetical protein
VVCQDKLDVLSISHLFFSFQYTYDFCRNGVHQSELGLLEDVHLLQDIGIVNGIHRLVEYQANTAFDIELIVKNSLLAIFRVTRTCCSLKYISFPERWVW